MSTDPKTADSRRGPSPLPVHVGLAMAEYSRMQLAGEVSPQQMEAMLAGIRKYQEHPYRRDMVPLPVVWQRGTVSLLHCQADNPKASLLLVPSLINKSIILDLMPNKSFVRWLAAQGIDTYLLDWGQPVDDPSLYNIDALVTERLGPAIAQVAQQNGGPVHALGYCMGGTLLVAAALQQSDNLRSIILLASPWDFSAGDKQLATQVKMGTPAALQMLTSEGKLPMDWIQSVFAAVNAGRALRKFSEFAAVEDGSDAARLFVSVEDWLNDGVDMPKALAETCILDWYGKNKPGNGTWEVAGRVIDLADLQIPALVVASQNDRLVPRESSTAMAAVIPDATVLEPSSGHIGMMTGSKAEQTVWKPVADWVIKSA